MRRLLKLLHTLGAAGLVGSMASLVVLAIEAPQPAALADYALMSGATAAIATWVFFPSLAVTLVAGLLAIAVNRAFHNAGWAWVKLASGILIFEGGFTAVLGPMQERARESAEALARHADPATLSGGSDRNALLALLAVALANVALGIWRPRLTSIPD